MDRLSSHLFLSMIGLSIACFAAVAHGAGQDADSTIQLAGGKLELKAPARWTRKQPQTAIVEHEFSISPADGDKAEGRLTIMTAGGGVEANIDRWFGQFSQPDGANTRDRAKVTKSKAGGYDVHLVDISGTFKDQRGPVAPAVERPKYRMLAAIISAPKAGNNYFIKFYGPERTVAENEKAFVGMIEGLRSK